MNEAALGKHFNQWEPNNILINASVFTHYLHLLEPQLHHSLWW